MKRWSSNLAFFLLLLCLLCLAFLPALTRAHGGHEAAPPPPAASVPSATAPAPAPPVNLQSSDLVGNKCGSMAVFFIVPFVGCCLAWFFRINLSLIMYGMLFSAGLFFSLALEHLLGDSVQSFSELTTDTYPYPFMILVSGYMLTWLADLAVRAVWDHREEKERRKQQLEQKLKQGDAEPARVVSCCKSPATVGVEEDVEAAAAVTRSKTCSAPNCSCDGVNCSCSYPGLEFSEAEEFARAAGGGQPGSRVSDLGITDLLFLTLALCFHAVFEGLAVGLANNVSDVWNTTLTVCLHKFFEGLALGTTLFAQDSTRSFLSFLLYACGFSIMAPIGIAIGIILDSETSPNEAQWVEAIGNGLAAGVFIYVAVSHLIGKAMKMPHGPKAWWANFVKWAFCGLGVLTNSLLMMRSS